MMRTWFILLTVGCVAFNTGCATFDTGPKMADTVGAMAQTVLLEITKDLKASEGMIAAGGSAHNPEYEVTAIIAPAAIYTKFNMRLIGVAINADAQAAMDPDEDIDPAYDVDVIRNTLMQPQLTRAAKRKLLMEVTNRTLEFWEKFFGLTAVDAAVTEPATKPTETVGPALPREPVPK